MSRSRTRVSIGSSSPTTIARKSLRPPFRLRRGAMLLPPPSAGTTARKNIVGGPRSVTSNSKRRLIDMGSTRRSSAPTARRRPCISAKTSSGSPSARRRCTRAEPACGARTLPRDYPKESRREHARRGGSTDPGEDRERSERDHLARAAGGLEGERDGTLARTGQVHFCTDRVEVPPPVGPLLLPQVRERVAQSRIVSLAESGPGGG